jgi:hypothetical protein
VCASGGLGRVDTMECFMQNVAFCSSWMVQILRLFFVIFLHVDAYA